MVEEGGSGRGEVWDTRQECQQENQCAVWVTSNLMLKSPPCQPSDC